MQGVILKPNPTYQNLFGYIEYRFAEGSVETLSDKSMR